MAFTRISALATILAIFYACGTAASPSGRILNGEDTATGQLPWVASVRVDNAHIAVGNQNSVLTSAHGLSALATTAIDASRVSVSVRVCRCVLLSTFSSAISIDASRVSVRVGSINQYAGGQIVSAKSILIHPSFGNFLHDIAIITLEQSLSFTDKIAAITLATSEIDGNLTVGTNVSLAGWGLQQSGAAPYKLQQTTLQVLSPSLCEYEAGYGYDSVLCLQHPVNQGISRGDDGAGVVANNTLVGVASFFFGVGGTQFPDVSSRVAYYSEWIADNTATSSA